MPEKVCPAPVLELLERLKQSGTGKSKLKALYELGCCCNGAEEFLAKAKELVGEGTYKKILAFVAEKEAAKQEGLAPLVGSNPTPSDSPATPRLVNPTQYMKADEAITFIKETTDFHVLSAIRELDERVTVQQAVVKRLSELHYK